MSAVPTAPDVRGTVLVADVGRTSCRVARYRNGDAGRVHQVPSGSSLADPDGVALLGSVALGAAQRVLGHDHPEVVVIGTTGAAQDPVAARDLATAIQARFPGARVLVTSDVVTAHCGALAGSPGVVLVAGTGAVALTASGESAPQLVDGAGWLLGDDGGGVWIGRAGLRAAVRWHDGREGGSADLACAAQARFGPPEQLVEHVQGQPSPARLLASFAPDVLDLASDGETVAGGIVAAAVTELAGTAVAASRGWSPERRLVVSCTGGLFDRTDLVAAPWSDAVTRALPWARVQDPVGDALDGAYRLVVTPPGFYREMVHDIPPALEEADRPAVG